MSIQSEYYLSCNKCGKVYAIKSDDPQGVEDEAIDDGWVVTGDDQDVMLSQHICPECVAKSNK